MRFGSPFHCSHCQTELRIARSDANVGIFVTVLVSIFAAFMAGLRGWSLVGGAALLAVPFAFATSFVRRHTSPPKLELSGSALKLTDK